MQQTIITTFSVALQTIITKCLSLIKYIDKINITYEYNKFI